MSGGIHYRPNPTEISVLEESWNQPKDLTKLQGDDPARLILKDSETTIRVEHLGDQTRFTLVVPMDNNADPKDGRLYLHDRYTVSSANLHLQSREQAYSTQADFFPEGPDWLLAQPLPLPGRPANSQEAKWNQLLRRLRSIPSPPADLSLQSQLWLPQLHQSFPDGFFDVLGKNLHIYQEILTALQKRRLQMRFTETQSGFAIIPTEAGEKIRLTIVIDRPEKSGLKEEANGRIYFYEDWTLSPDRKSVVAWERKYETVGELSQAMEKCLEELNQLQVPSLETVEVQNTLELLIQNLTAHRNFQQYEKPTANLVPEPENPQDPTQPLISPALKDLANKLLMALDLPDTESSPDHLPVFKQLLQHTLQGVLINSQSIGEMQTQQELSVEEKTLILIWIHLLQNRIDLAQKEWIKLPKQSHFTQRLGEELNHLSLQKGAQEILPLLRATSIALKFSSSGDQLTHDLALQKNESFWQRLQEQVLLHAAPLQQALANTHPQNDSETQLMLQISNHPLLQDLIALAEEPDQRNRQELLQTWAKQSLISQYGFFDIAALVLQNTPPTISRDAELLAWADGNPSLGQTLEWSHPKIMEAVFAPRNLLAMAAGVSAGAVTSRFFLARVPIGMPGSTFAAESLGLFFEAPAFVMTGALYDSTLAEKKHTIDSSTFLKELGSAYLVFGPLKAARWGARGSASILARRGWWQAHPKTLALAEGSLAHTLGPLSLSLGNALSRSSMLGWQPQSPLGWKGNLVLDGVTYAHFLLGGGLAQAAIFGVKGIPSVPKPSRNVPNTGARSRRDPSKAYLDFEMDLGRVHQPLVEPIAVLEGRQHIPVRGKDDQVVLQLENLGRIPLKGDQALWTFGREHEGAQDLHIALSRDFKQVSRKQGYISVNAEGQFTYTDLSRYGVTVDGLSVPPQVSVPLKFGTTLQFGLDRHLEFTFFPNEGAKPSTQNQPLVPDYFLDALNPPSRTKRHPALEELDDAQMQEYMGRIHSQNVGWNNSHRVQGHFGSLLVNGRESFLLNADRTVWFIGRQPEIGIQSDFMEKHMGIIRTPDAGEDVAAIHAVLYITPDGRVALQNLERGRRVALQIPQYTTEDFGPDSLRGFTQALEVPNWTYLQGKVRILLGEDYLLDFTGNLVTPLDRSTLRPESVRTQDTHVGEEILEGEDWDLENPLGPKVNLPRWDEQTLTLAGKVDLEIRPTQELAGSMLTVDPRGSRAVLLLPVTDPQAQGARIYSTDVGSQRLYMITSLPPSTSQGRTSSAPTPPAVKNPSFEDTFAPIPLLGQKPTAFSLTQHMQIRIGDYEFQVKIPE